MQKRLNTELEGYAVTVDTTAARLAAYAQVANTYLSTFQTLGSLGLMLGAIGLAVVLLRGLVERRAELALLTAIGFAPAAAREARAGGERVPAGARAADRGRVCPARHPADADDRRPQR